MLGKALLDVILRLVKDVGNSPVDIQVTRGSVVVAPQTKVRLVSNHSSLS